MYKPFSLFKEQLQEVIERPEKLRKAEYQRRAEKAIATIAKQKELLTKVIGLGFIRLEYMPDNKVRALNLRTMELREAPITILVRVVQGIVLDTLGEKITPATAKKVIHVLTNTERYKLVFSSGAIDCCAAEDLDIDSIERRNPGHGSCRAIPCTLESCEDCE